MKERNRYLKIVEWSEEDKCYVGSVPGWLGACCHGDKDFKKWLPNWLPRGKNKKGLANKRQLSL